MPLIIRKWECTYLGLKCTQHTDNKWIIGKCQYISLVEDLLYLWKDKEVKVHRTMATLVHGTMVTLVHRTMATLVHGTMVTLVHRTMATLVHGTMVTLVHGTMVTLVHRTMVTLVQWLLYLFFHYHSSFADFFHRKPHSGSLVSHQIHSTKRSHDKSHESHMTQRGTYPYAPLLIIFILSKSSFFG